MVSYDDVTSFGTPRFASYPWVFIDLCLHHTAAKGKFIGDTGLAGFAMWQAGGDSNDILLDAISRALGVNC